MKRESLVWGSVLVLLGLLFLVGQLFPALISSNQLWPISIILVGAALLVIGLINNVSPMAIPFSVVVGIGGMLWWQNSTGNWSSWAYTWTLIPGFVGVGFVIWGLLDRKLQRLLRASLSLIGVSLLAFLLYAYLFTSGLWTWPLIIVGAGVIFLLLSPLLPLAPFTIPGSIIGGIGLILWWQNATGNWASWAYTWALIPIFVAVGMLLMGVFGVLKRGVVRASQILILIGVATFTIFATAFNFRNPLVGILWPAALVVLGGYYLVSALTRKPR